MIPPDGWRSLDPLPPEIVTALDEPLEKSKINLHHDLKPRHVIWLLLLLSWFLI